MIRATTTVCFIAGHRLQHHEDKCRRPHGHNYRAEITVRSIGGTLDRVGRVVDFDVVEEVAGRLLKRWDHRELLEADDPWAVELTASAIPEVRDSVIGLSCAPSAENLARIIGAHMEAELATVQAGQIVVEAVRLYETEDCWADWTPA